MNNQSISVIVPVYNGEKYLPELVEKLEYTRKEFEDQFSSLIIAEAIFVVDDCIDDSLSVLRRLESDYNWIHIIELSKNFGQHPATVTGILHSSGDWIFTLDEDLQHNPENMKVMLKNCVANSMDVCYARPNQRVHASFIKDSISSLFKSFVSFLIKNPNVKNFSSFRCIRGSIARGAAATCSLDTYFDIALSWFTNRICVEHIQMKDTRNSNEEGKSGYSLWGLIRHGKKLVLSSKLKFLRLITILGIVSFSFSIVYSIYVLFRFFGDESIPIKGWPSTIVSIYFFGGLTCLFLGIILEVLTEILMKSRGKPSFFVVDRSTDAYITREMN